MSFATVAILLNRQTTFARTPLILTHYLCAMGPLPNTNAVHSIPVRNIIVF